MDATADYVVVRLLLLPDRIIIPGGQKVPGHTFVTMDQIPGQWRFNYRLDQASGDHVFTFVAPLECLKDRRRYIAGLDDVREKIASNLRGDVVQFSLETDPGDPLPWAIDKPEVLCPTA